MLIGLQMGACGGIWQGPLAERTLQDPYKHRRHRDGLMGVMMQQMSFPISGMTCAACVARVERRLTKIAGVASAEVNLATETAALRFESPADAGQIVAGIRAAGFDVPETQLDFAISGMTCASCVARVERAIAKVDGVARVAVNLATETATVTVSATGGMEESILRAVAKTGFTATPMAADMQARDAEKERDAARLTRDLALSAVLTLPLAVIEMGGHMVPALHHAFGGAVWRYVSLALASLVLFGPGLRFWRKGWAGLRAGAPDMNSLVMTGAGAAWAFSALSTLAPQVLPAGTAAVYFESTAIIVTLVLAGRWLEARAKRQTSDAIRALMALTPQEAVVIRDNRDVTVPLAEVRVGDVLLLRAGERVAVDGVVLSGTSHVDESMLTGEARFIAKSAGDMVTGGTLNVDGSLRVTATRVGAETVLAQILRMVQAAQGAKLPIQAMVDRITRWFVPVVMGIAALTFVAWMIFGGTAALPQALVHAVAVLIIACPCAMGLATPVSIMVGTGRAAAFGVLFRNGAALQALAGVKTIAFDKTGTLTLGRPMVVSRHLLAGFDADTVLRLTAALELGAQHPLGLAFRDAVSGDLPEVTRFETIIGKGLTGAVAGKRLLVGSASLMEENGLGLAPLAQARAALDAAGQTPVYVAIDGQMAALFGLADALRPEAGETVAALHGMDLSVAMISGDSQAVAARIAGQIGIDQVTADVLPAGKVRALQTLAGPVAFVGDGINDAPALAAADVGIAIGAGTAVAVDSADVVLSGHDLGALVRAIGLAKATLHNIKQNLFWAFAYNAALIPVAAGVLAPAFGISLSPVWAAGAMALSSVFVLTNALRLRRWGA